MRGIVIRWLVLTIGVTAASYLIDGIVVSGPGAALMAGAILGFLNAFFRPILLLLTLPLNLLTLGLFTFVINALLLMMVSGVVGGFEVQGFWSALGGSLLVSLVSWALTSLVSDEGRVEVISLRRKNGDHWE